MIIALPLLFCIVGLLIYVLATNGKVVEIGRTLFWCGLLAFLLVGSEPLVKLLGNR
jgi:hypothetical protein